jgi:hypothetical protein
MSFTTFSYRCNVRTNFLAVQHPLSVETKEKGKISPCNKRDEVIIKSRRIRWVGACSMHGRDDKYV